VIDLDAWSTKSQTYWVQKVIRNNPKSISFNNGSGNLKESQLAMEICTSVDVV
jgi:ketopantoate reductase